MICYRFRLIIIITLLYASSIPLTAQLKHIYLANDNHTDYYWTDNAAAYEQTALKEIDYYLNLADATANLATPYQSRYNLDGAWYVYTYQQKRSEAQFNRLIQRIKSGHISVPYNYFVSTYGGQTMETILRGMYWSGSLERRYNLDLNLAVSMENQTQPLGLASLWAGSGAKYSWKGVCGCTSEVAYDPLTSRTHEIYHYKGLDSTGVLMKWYSLIPGSNRLGGYAEARDPAQSVEDGEEKCNTTKYPYNIVGAFGYGWDDLEAITDVFPRVAQNESDNSKQVYVSNESDFFIHFENTYNTNALPSESVTYGNEWDINCASLAAMTAKMRTSVEKLRTAEALASTVSILNPDFYKADDPRRTQAWIALGSYWEHNFGLDGCCYPERSEWEVGLQQKVTYYVDSLYSASLNALAANVHQPSAQSRFAVFNALNWARTDAATIVYNGNSNIKVIDIQTNTQIPHQIIQTDTNQLLRILAMDVPSVGYKVYEIQSGTGNSFPNAATLNGKVFENAFYKITITSEGVITSLIDKSTNEEFVKVTNGRYLNDFGQGNRDAGTLRLLYNGPVSATIACASSRPLNHTTYITLYNTINRIDIENHINDDYGDNIRTYSFSFNLNNPTVWHEELGAIIKAKYTTSGGHYAPPGQAIRHDWQTLNHFADIGVGNKGMLLSNEGAAFMKLGNSSINFLDQNSNQINVLIGGVMFDFGNDNSSNQFGIKAFKNAFALRTRARQFDSMSAMKFALEHQNAFATTFLTNRNNDPCSTLPQDTFSLLHNSDPHTILWALKPAEEGVENGGFIVRLWNLDTLPHLNAIHFSKNITSAKKTTHLETDIMDATVESGDLVANIGQRRVETFRVFLNNSGAQGNILTKEIDATICPGEVYQGYTQTGVYRDTFPLASGCGDSVRILNLMALPAIDTLTITKYTCNPTQAGTSIKTWSAAQGCDSTVVTTTIFEPFRYTFSKTDASCSGLSNGQATIASANTNYAYAWSNGAQGATASNLAAGTYTVTITDLRSNCTAEENITIQNQRSFSIRIIGQDDYCVNGFIIATASGGIAPYQYEWSTGDTTQSVLGIDAGNYEVTITDSEGCVNTASKMIEDYDLLQLEVNKTDITCFGAINGRIEVVASGGVPPYQIQWSNGASGTQLENLNSGNYILNFSDSAGCNVAKTVTIQEPSAINLNLRLQSPSNTTSLDGGATVNPSGGRSPYRILWSNGATESSISNLNPGSYSVTVTDVNGCNQSSNFNLTALTSLTTIPSLYYFKLFPNPVAGTLYVTLEFNKIEQGYLLLHDVTGKEVFREKFRGRTHLTTIQTEPFTSGTYQLRVTVGKQEVVRSIIVH